MGEWEVEGTNELFAHLEFCTAFPRTNSYQDHHLKTIYLNPNLPPRKPDCVRSCQAAVGIETDHNEPRGWCSSDNFSVCVLPSMPQLMEGKHLP